MEKIGNLSQIWSQKQVTQAWSIWTKQVTQGWSLKEEAVISSLIERKKQASQDSSEGKKVT